MTKKIVSITFFLAIFVSISPVVHAASKTLSLQFRHQELNNWCWSAASQMILRYYGRYFVEQCEISEYARQRNSAWFGTTYCCHKPDSTATTKCNRVNSILSFPPDNTDGHISDILENYNVNNSVTSSTLTYTNCKTQIDNSKPFIVRWGWTDSGHFIVVHGYSDASGGSANRLIISDSNTDVGTVLTNYADVVTPPGGTWTHTLTTSSNAPNDKVQLYTNTNFSGTSYTVSGNIADLVAGPDDTTSSAQVHGVPWIFYDGANYTGTSWPANPYHHSSYSSWNGTDNTVTALRKVPGITTPTLNSPVAIVLFDGENYTGSSYYVITSNTTDLNTIGWSNKISSMIVINGIWNVYASTNYSGTQYAVTSFGGPKLNGFYPTSASWGGSNNDIESIYNIPESWDPILLYQNTNYYGRAVALHMYTPVAWLNDLSLLGMANNISAVKTVGYQNIWWYAYTGTNQSGTYYSFLPNYWYPEAVWGADNTIESMYIIEQ